MRLPLLVIAIFLVILAVSYLPIKRELVYALQISGDPTTSCCRVDDILNSKGDFETGAETAYFNNKAIPLPQKDLAQSNASVNPSGQVLGMTTNSKGEEKWIEVSLQNQEVVAWEGHTLIQKFPISSGKWYPTPTGTFHIWYKTRNQRMEGGSKLWGTYYNLPNVPNNMFFYEGYAIHGAYWHNNFGQPMSHGCVNAPLDQVDDLFEWAGPVVPDGVNFVKASPENPGTRVWVH